MLELEEAVEKIMARLTPMPIEEVPLAEAVGRVAAKEMKAECSLPAFDNSAMDGYAVRASDVNHASFENPVALKIVGEIPAGSEPSACVESGEAVRIFTGSMLPRGADAVVMQEDTRLENQQEVLVLDRVKPGENVRFEGEDIPEGRLLLTTGEPVRLSQLPALQSMGWAFLPVHQQPKVTVLATGDELCESGSPLRPGKIYETNRAAICSLVRKAGGLPQVGPIVSDRLDATVQALSKAFQESDLVVSCGGVSVGSYDFVQQAFSELGGELEFWKVAMKPGKPLLVGRWKGKLLLGLPGNPVSSWTTFLLCGWPVIKRLQGAHRLTLPARTGHLAAEVFNKGNRRHFLRVHMDAHGLVWPCGVQQSHRLYGLALSNGFLDMPAETRWQTNRTVEVLLWEMEM